MIFSLFFYGLVIYLIIRAFSHRSIKPYRWLQQELPVWEQKNIITQEQGNAILNIYNLQRVRTKEKMDVVKVLTLIGALFIGVGVIFFVASNWQRIPALVRTSMLLFITLATLYAGYFFSYKKEGFVHLGKNLLLLASLFWGGTIALIAQIYHIPVSENWYIMLLWAFPILPIAICFDNDYVHILATLLLVVWNFLYMHSNNAANYYYPFIVFALMLPTSKNLPISRGINSLALIITSIYCCFTRFEWLALFISAGLLGYYLLQRANRIYLYTASLSFLCWTVTYFTIREQQPNFYFLAAAGIMFYLTYRDKVRENLAICLIAFLTWINLTCSSFSHVLNYHFSLLHFIVFQSLLGGILYIFGMIFRRRENLFFEIYTLFGYIIVFGGTYILSFKSLLEESAGKFNPVYAYTSLFLAGLLLLLVLTEVIKGYLKNKIERIELTVLILSLLLNSMVLANSKMLFAIAVIANVVLVIFALSTIFWGVEVKAPSVFNTGVIMFILFILTRYIDMGWKLKEKSLFFIAGGIVILSLGILVEKQRRKVIERMAVK